MEFFTNQAEYDIKPFIPNKKIHEYIKLLRKKHDRDLYAGLNILREQEVIRIQKYHNDSFRCVYNNTQMIIKLKNQLTQNKLNLELDGYQKINVIKTLYLEECINNKINLLISNNHKLIKLRQFTYQNELFMQIQEFNLNNLNYII
jgi:hypothetical protein